MDHVLWCNRHPLVLPDIVKGEGCYLYDLQGKKYLDLESGIWCLPLGHCHAQIKNAILAQAGILAHSGYCYANPIMEQASNALKSIDDHAFSLAVTRDTVQAYTGKVIEAPRLFAAWKVERDIPLVKAAEAGVMAAGLAPKFGSWGFCTNGSETAGKRKIPTIGLGPGAEDDAHIADESISVEELRKAKIAYEHLVLNLATD